MAHKVKQLPLHSLICALSLTLLAGCRSLEFPSQQAQATREQAVNECFNAWVNTEATPENIESGLLAGVLAIDPVTGLYYTTTKSTEFDNWVGSQSGIPWSYINQDLRWGPGCRYIRETKELETRARRAAECLDSWVNSEAAHATIMHGLDLKVLILDPASSLYHVDVDHENLRRWVTEGSTSNPWADIRAEAVYGSGHCPYG